MDEATYTLDEAEREIRRRDCAAGQHRPSVEIAALDSPVSSWLCDCGEYTYEATPARP